VLIIILLILQTPEMDENGRITKPSWWYKKFKK
jgi:hypothetical protein